MTVYLLQMEHYNLVRVRTDGHGGDISDVNAVLDHHTVVLHQDQVLCTHHQQLLYCLKSHITTL